MNTKTTLQNAPWDSCEGASSYTFRSRPSNLLTSFELDWLGLERPAARAGVLVKGSSEWDLFRACQAAPAATPAQRRRIVVETRLNRACPICFALTDRPVDKQGPLMCDLCASVNQTTLPHCMLPLPLVGLPVMERPWEVSAVLQLVEFEARAVLEGAEVVRVEEQRDLLGTAVDSSGPDHIELRFCGITAHAAELVAPIQAWREVSGIPQLDGVNGEVVLRALKQALARLEAPDHFPQAPLVGLWSWGDMLSWLHTMCAHFYLKRGYVNTAEIETARRELSERFALLWWYERARGAGSSWLVVPTMGRGLKEITSVGKL